MCDERITFFLLSCLKSTRCQESENLFINTPKADAAKSLNFIKRNNLTSHVKLLQRAANVSCQVA